MNVQQYTCVECEYSTLIDIATSRLWAKAKDNERAHVLRVKCPKEGEGERARARAGAREKDSKRKFEKRNEQVKRDPENI